MATSRAFCTLTLSVHSSQPPTPKATGWSNTTGSSGPGSILAAHGGVRDLPNTMGAHQVAQRFKKKKKRQQQPMDRGAWRATVHGVARFGHD